MSVGPIKSWIVGWVIIAAILGILVWLAPENTKQESLATNLLASVLIAPVIVFFLEHRIQHLADEREKARVRPRDERIRSGLQSEIGFVLNRIFGNPMLLGELEIPWLEDGDLVAFLAGDWPAKRAKLAEGIRNAPWPLLQLATTSIEERQERLIDLSVLGFDPLPAEVHRHLMNVIEFSRTAVERERAGRFVLARDTREKGPLEKVFGKHLADQLVPLVDALVEAHRGLANPSPLPGSPRGGDA